MGEFESRWHERVPDRLKHTGAEADIHIGNDTGDVAVNMAAELKTHYPHTQRYSARFL